MKLYMIVGSGNCRKVQATANHLGIKLDYEYLDWLSMDHKKPEYLAVNPNGRVPTLRDGDFTLWESAAIMQYLANKVPGNTLFPTDNQLRADITRWQCWETAHFNRWLGMLVYETVLKPQFLKQEPTPTVVKNAQSELAGFAAVLEAQLQGRDYLVGNHITLADYSVIQQESFSPAVPFDWHAYPNIAAYFERMRAVPHWASTAPSSPAAAGRKPPESATRYA
ncbi:MAG: glutathione S-transferase family protein [Stenotrophobium sp.]